MTDPASDPSTDPVAPIFPTPITLDTPCARCRYNLRGLNQGMRCPECGTPVDFSFHGNLLRFADPQWVRRLQFGTTLKLWNILFVLLLGIGAAVLSMVFSSPVVTILFGMVMWTLGLWATFLITSPEPNVATEEGLTLRLWIRLAAVVAVVGSLISQSAQLSGGFAPSAGIGTAPAISPSGTAIIIMLVGSFLQLLGIVQWFGEFVYFRRFARRIPDPKLERSTTTVMWGTVISYAVTIASGFVVAILAVFGIFGAAATSGASGSGLSPGFAIGMAASGFVICAAVISLAVFGIWYLRLLAAYRNAFMSAAAGGISLY